MSTGPVGKPPCEGMLYSFQFMPVTHSVTAQAPCWYIRGTRLANRRRIALPSAGSLPPYPIAASTMKEWPEKTELGRVREATKSIWNSFSRPRRRSSSPIGERHCVAGGAGTATSCKAARSFFKSSVDSPLTFRVAFRADRSHISCALFFPTRLKDSTRKSASFRSLAAAIRLSWPNSIPCGCGWIATGQAITSLLTLSNVNDSSSSSTRKRACGLTTDVYRRYSSSFFLADIVLLNSICTRVPWIRSHSNGISDMISGSLVSILIWISNLWADSFAPVREMIMVGTPLVSCA